MMVYCFDGTWDLELPRTNESLPNAITRELLSNIPEGCPTPRHVIVQASAHDTTRYATIEIEWLGHSFLVDDSGNIIATVDTDGGVVCYPGEHVWASYRGDIDIDEHGMYIARSEKQHEEEQA